MNIRTRTGWIDYVYQSFRQTLHTVNREPSLPTEIRKPRPSGCIELTAGNEFAQRHLDLPGLEAHVIARPSGSREGGDLYALFSCAGERIARIVLADCVGHGFDAGQIAAHVHKLLHQFRDISDNSRLLAALNDEFTLTGQSPGVPLRLSTVVTATFDRDTGEFNYAYAAHPRMMLWRVRDRRWWTLGEGLDGPPIGFICGELYVQQSIRVERGDIVLIYSDGATDVFSEDGTFLGQKGLLQALYETMVALTPAASLAAFGESLVRAISRFHGSDDLADDLTLLTLRRP